MFDYLIVGAGFAGSVLAERLANGSGKRVLICDKRPHIAGNALRNVSDEHRVAHRQHLLQPGSDGDERHDKDDRRKRIARQIPVEQRLQPLS